MAQDDSDLKQAMFQVSDGIIGAAVLIVIGVMAGNWLDAQLHTSPWLLIILSVLGGGLGLGRLVRKAMLIGQSQPAVKSLRTKSEGGISQSESIDKDLPAPRSSESGSTSGPRSAYERFQDDD